MSGIYVKLDAAFFADDRIVECSPLAQLLYVRGLCIAQTIETDGRLTLAQLRRECGDLNDLPEIIVELTKSGLWIASDDDRVFVIASWLKKNKPAAEIARIRADRQRAGQAGGIASGASRRGEANTKQVLQDDHEANEAKTKQVGNPAAAAAAKADAGTAAAAAGPVDQTLVDLVSRRLAAAKVDRKIRAGEVIRKDRTALEKRIADEDYSANVTALTATNPGWTEDQLFTEIDRAENPPRPAYTVNGHTTFKPLRLKPGDDGYIDYSEPQTVPA